MLNLVSALFNAQQHRDDESARLYWNRRKTIVDQ